MKREYELYCIQLNKMYWKQSGNILTENNNFTILRTEADMEGKQKKYQKLIDYIDNLIREGKLGPGDKLYSENELSEMFHISRQTVRKALGFLEGQGVGRRVRGRGT